MFSCRLSLVVLLTALLSSTYAQQATISEEEWPIKTYPFSDPDPVPILRSNPAIYPYFAFDGFTSKSVMKKWKVVVLENQYLKVFVLPEVGGKVFGGIEKSTGREFIYMNDVMKFRRIALRGPWTSGGIEFNFGIIGHTPSTATPVDYALRSNPDGSVTCFVGTLDLPSRTRWSVAITLPRDKAYVETRPLWQNPTPYAQSYYVWTTSAISARQDLQYFYPGRSVVPHSFSIENATWPVNRGGRDLSWYKNNEPYGNQSHFVFGEFGDFFGAYWHQLGFGMGHWARYSDMPGRKIWIWSLARDGGIWEGLLTDTKGQYSEPQAGRLFSQVDHEFFQPYTADLWREIWFPVKEIGGIVAASPYGVMNATRSGDSLQIGVCGLDSFDDTLTVRIGGAVLFKEPIRLTPMRVEKRRVSLPADSRALTVSIGRKLKYSTEESSVVSRPIDYRESPPRTAEAHYQSGQFHEKQRQYTDALNEYRACLSEDSNHIGALAHTALLYGRRGEYEYGLSYAARALRSAKYDPGANYAYGVLSRKLGRTHDAKETLGWASRSLEYRSNAYTQIAEIAIQESSIEEAIEYAQRALDFNSLNVNAYLVLAIARRLNGDVPGARETLAHLSGSDPLCHEAAFERYLLEPSEERRDEWRKSIRAELPHETYLEIAVRYVSLGLIRDAIAVLEKAPPHPMVHYWLAYLQRGDSGRSRNELALGEALPVEFVFPFREESLPVLKWVLDTQSDRWKPRFYLGLLLWGKGREEAALEEWKRVKTAPYAPFYLSRAALTRKVGGQGIQEDLGRALELDPSSWRAWHALAEHRAELGQYNDALKLTRDAARRFPGNVVIEVDKATALHNTGNFTECLEVLKSLEVLPYEGSWEARDLFARTHLRIAMEKMKVKDWSAALRSLDQSREYPEHLGSGKPWEPDERLQDMLAAVCYKQMREQKKFEMTHQRIRDFTARHGAAGGSEHYAGVIALRAVNEHDKATQVLGEWEQLAPTDPVLKWLSAQARGTAADAQEIESANAKDQRFRLRIEAMKMALAQ